MGRGTVAYIQLSMLALGLDSAVTNRETMATKKRTIATWAGSDVNYRDVFTHTSGVGFQAQSRQPQMLSSTVDTCETAGFVKPEGEGLRVPGTGLRGGPLGCAGQLVPGHALSVHNEHVILVAAPFIHPPKDQ